MAGAVALLVLAPGAAAIAQSPGADGPAVLQSPGSVRAAGLQGAGAAILGDAAAIFANPAGLALVRRLSLEAGYFGAPFDAYQATGALAVRVGQVDVGFGLKHFDFGAEPEVTPDPVTGGVTGLPTGATIHARELLAVGSLVYRFGVLALGASVKGVDQQIGDFNDHGVSADLGAAIALFDLAALGFAVQNVSGNWDDQSVLVLPRLTRVGFTMNYTDPQETYRLLSTLEVQWPEGRTTRFVFGVEGGIVTGGVGLLARGAYGTQEADAATSRLSLGGSLTLGGMTVDYAYVPTDLMGGGSQRFGVRLSL
jgi:hypothetical protein